MSIRMPFRLKLFLPLGVTLAGLLVAALAAVDSTSAERIDDLIALRARQGLRSFQELGRRRQRNLIEALDLLATAPRVRAAFLDRGSLAEAMQSALYEVGLRQTAMDLLVVADADGKVVSRYLYPAGAKQADPIGARPLPLPVPSAQHLPEQELIARVLAGDAPETLDPILVVEDRLFLAVPTAILDLDVAVGVMVLGVEITDADAAEVHGFQSENDHIAWLVGGQVRATSFSGAEERRRATEALAVALPTQREDTPRQQAVSIGPESYRALIQVLRPAGDPAGGPVHLALFISMDSLVRFRAEMRSLTMILALIALALAMAVSLLVAGQVSRPVRDLAEGTRRIAEGDYAYRIQAHSGDELGDLARSFNRMAEDIASKEKVRAVLNKVVAREVAEELLRSDLGLSGRLVTATLLFADLRGFTAFTRGMDPERVVSILNEHMTAMSAEILRERGIVDKYVGDEIIGVFGAPRSYPDDALAAVRAAVRMRTRLEEQNRERRLRGDAPLAMGIGLHTGRVVAGCMGSQDLLNFTCIGEAVNLAARLCTSAGAGEILISEATLVAAGDRVQAERREPLRLKGFDEPVAAWQVQIVADQPGTECGGGA